MPLYHGIKSSNLYTILIFYYMLPFSLDLVAAIIVPDECHAKILKGLEYPGKIVTDPKKVRSKVEKLVS